MINALLDTSDYGLSHTIRVLGAVGFVWLTSNCICEVSVYFELELNTLLTNLLQRAGSFLRS